jgi:hypothetical protein
MQAKISHFWRAVAEPTDRGAGGEPGQAAEVIVNARLFDRNGNVPAEVFEFVEGLPSLPAPDALASPLRRSKALAKLLTDDEVPGGALLDDAGEQLIKADAERPVSSWLM